MSNTNLNYSKENEFLPQNLRWFIGQPNKVAVQTFDAYFCLFDQGDKYILLNNWMAAKFASGWTRMNYASVQSGVAPRLLKIKVSKTVGKVFYQVADNSQPREAESEEENQALDMNELKVDQVLPTDYLSKKLYEAFDKSERTGRCAMVLYKGEEEDSKAYIETFDAFRHQLDFDKKGNVREAKFFILGMDDMRRNFARYFIVEKRYYNSKGEPCQKIVVRYQTYAGENRDDIKTDIYELENKDIPDWLKEKFSDVYFNREQVLEGFSDLGVYHIDCTATNSKFPDSKIPEAMFVDALDTIVMLEQGLTDKEVEKEIGRGQVMIPEFGKEYAKPMFGNIGANQSAIAQPVILGTAPKNPVITKYPTKSTDESKPHNVQFDFRPDQWALSNNEDIARLCAITGISIMDFDPRLLQSGQRTDDEINAMTDITANTIQTTRNLNEPEINKMLACLSMIYELPSPVKIRWDMATILNPSKNASRIAQLVSAQLISRKQALRELYPNLMPQELAQLYREVEAERSFTPEKEILQNYDNF